ncbi:MAG: sigma-70 family RNA polymerase sigma factor [Micrococcales bacterium]|nr:sigma-70 family RNA polymerase sigma factor [Micrococcales bacterium]
MPAPGNLDTLITTHSPRIYRHAYHLTGNRFDAEDLTQETFVRVITALDAKGAGSLEGWMHRITTNLFLDQARRRARLRFESLGEAEELLEDPASDPLDIYVSRHLDAAVSTALAALPEQFRQPFVLRAIEGCSYEEIAQILGLKLGTVRSRIHRARGWLQQWLERPAPGTSG